MALVIPVLYGLLLVFGFYYAWRRYRASKNPTSQDADQLKWFAKYGRDLTRDQPLELTLSFVDSQAAESAAERLRQRGYTVSVTKSDVDREWLCEATRNEVPTLALVEQVRADGETVARDCGGEYCGWGFAELKDGP
jgi:hypothetical protein